MSDPERTIVAMGGGGFSMGPDVPLLDDHVLELARARRGRERPSVCFMATASGDSEGYGFLPGCFCPHYDSEPARRPTYQGLIADATLPDGYAADDGAGLVFRDTELAEVVTSRPAAHAYRVTRGTNGAAVETEVPFRYLG